MSDSANLRGVVEAFLAEVGDIVASERALDYGHPKRNHDRTAKLWSVYLGQEISAEQVCMLNILQKVSRSMVSITDDTVLDIAGYSANLAAIRQKDRSG